MDNNLEALIAAIESETDLILFNEKSFTENFFSFDCPAELIYAKFTESRIFVKFQLVNGSEVSDVVSLKNYAKWKESLDRQSQEISQ